MKKESRVPFTRKKLETIINGKGTDKMETEFKPPHGKTYRAERRFQAQLGFSAWKYKVTN